MNGPAGAELAAIVAAYAVVTRASAPLPDAPAAGPSRWRLAARIELDGAPAARTAARRSAWRAAGG